MRINIKVSKNEMFSSFIPEHIKEKIFYVTYYASYMSK